MHKTVIAGTVIALLFWMAGCSLLGGSSETIEITVVNHSAYYLRATDVTTNIVFEDHIFYNNSGKFTINKGDTLLIEKFDQYGGGYVGESSASYDSTQTVTIS